MNMAALCIAVLCTTRTPLLASLEFSRPSPAESQNGVVIAAPAGRASRQRPVQGAAVAKPGVRNENSIPALATSRETSVARWRVVARPFELSQEAPG